MARRGRGHVVAALWKEGLVARPPSPDRSRLPQGAQGTQQDLRPLEGLAPLSTGGRTAEDVSSRLPSRQSDDAAALQLFRVAPSPPPPALSPPRLPSRFRSHQRSLPTRQLGSDLDPLLAALRKKKKWSKGKVKDKAYVYSFFYQSSCLS